MTATMTSGSIGTTSTDIVPVGEHTEKRTSDLLATTSFNVVKLEKTLGRKVGLDRLKYILDRSMDEVS